MGIEELENELKSLKAYAYDLNSEYAKLTQRIDTVTNELKALKENSVEKQDENDVVISENVELPTVESVEEKTEVEESPIETESTPLIPTVEIPEVSEENNEEINTNEISTQPLDQTPLTPIGVELPKIEEEVNKTVIDKVDADAPKAILINSMQGEKLRGSLETNESIVLNSETQQVELPNVEGVTDAVSLPQLVKTPEEEMKEMMEQAQQLYAEGKTAEAEQKMEEAKVFSKNVSEAAQ